MFIYSCMKCAVNRCMEMCWGNSDCMDSCTTSILLFRLFYFLQSPNRLHYSVHLLEPYYICFVNYIDFLMFLLHSQIGLFEKLCFVYFLLEKYANILRVLLFTLFIITVATAFIPIFAFSSCFALNKSCNQLSIRKCHFLTSIYVLYFYFRIL